MTIIYIPFERHCSGDLPAMVQLWKNRQIHAQQEAINIIYYKDDFDIDAIPPNSAVYVTAHGHKKDPTILANASTTSAICIKTAVAAKRFSSDFLAIMDKITNIHMYCCGNEKKNHELAKIFQQNLLRSEYSHINFYKGCIRAPDANGITWAPKRNKFVAITPKQILPIADMTQINQNDDDFHRDPVKSATKQESSERLKEISIQYYLNHNHDRKEDLIKKQRGLPVFRTSVSFFNQNDANTDMDVSSIMELS